MFEKTITLNRNQCYTWKTKDHKNNYIYLFVTVIRYLRLFLCLCREEVETEQIPVDNGGVESAMENVTTQSNQRNPSDAALFDEEMNMNDEVIEAILNDDDAFDDLIFWVLQYRNKLFIKVRHLVKDET